MIGEDQRLAGHGSGGLLQGRESGSRPVFFCEETTL